jgi:hypothetical protein
MLTKVLDPVNPPLSEKERNYLREAAQRCNDKKDASRHAQEASDELYLNLLVRDLDSKRTPLDTQAIVIDLGPKSFTVLLPELGMTKRVHVMDDFRWTVSETQTLGDQNDAPVICIQAKEPRTGTKIEIKVLSEFTVSLIPKQDVEQKKRMDFRVIPKKGSVINGAVIENTPLPKVEKDVRQRHRHPHQIRATHIAQNNGTAESGALAVAVTVPKHIQHRKQTLNQPKSNEHGRSGQISIKTPHGAPREAKAKTPRKPLIPVDVIMHSGSSHLMPSQGEEHAVIGPYHRRSPRREEGSGQMDDARQKAELITPRPQHPKPASHTSSSSHQRRHFTSTQVPIENPASLDKAPRADNRRNQARRDASAANSFEASSVHRPARDQAKKSVEGISDKLTELGLQASSAQQQEPTLEESKRG